MPVLGRLFSSELHSKDKTEIILAITPVVLNNLMRPTADLIQFSTGTESGQRGALGSSGAAVALPTQPSPLQRFPGNVAPNMPAMPSVNVPAVPAANMPLSNGPAAANAAQVSGVIPMADFQAPPGVGSPVAPPVVP
jgi:general secretion pathway protein D